MNLRPLGRRFRRPNQREGIVQVSFGAFEMRSAMVDRLREFLRNGRDFHRDAPVHQGHARHAVFSHDAGWVSGAMVTIKDQSRFLRLEQQNGRTVLVSHEVGEGQMAEVNFFRVHLASLRGIYAGYRGSASRRVFEWRMRGLLRDYLRANDIRGRAHLQVIPVLRPEDAEQLTRALHSIDKVEIRYAAVAEAGEEFVPLAEQIRLAERTIKFVQPVNIRNVVAIANATFRHSERTNPQRVRIFGEDADGLDQIIQLADNPVLFGQLDFDEFIALGDIDLENVLQSRQLQVVARMCEEAGPFFGEN